MRLAALIIFTFALGAKAQQVDKNYLLGKFDPATHTQFIKLSDEHTRGSARGAYLRKETYEAFVKMSEAALKDSVTL
ncbi:MAG TPA: hypothetical protein PKC10_14080, partial [Cyclobacteriaceae bacterium]|nr:hypothetical protein [Cyclobacteriaceae bacterium]